MGLGCGLAGGAAWPLRPTPPGSPPRPHLGAPLATTAAAAATALLLLLLLLLLL